MNDKNTNLQLTEAKEEYISQWGILGSNWGCNRTFSQIHGLLMISSKPLSTDDIMEELQISRGNAHSNIKELISWQLVRSVVKKGDRKEYFEAEKDVMKIFSQVSRERQRREIEPLVDFLGKMLDDTKDLKSAEAKAFKKQIKELRKFSELSSKVMSKFANMGESGLLKWAMKFIN